MEGGGREGGKDGIPKSELLPSHTHQPPLPPSSPLLYTFLDGQKVPKPIEMCGLKEESASLEHTEDELRRRISLLRGELAGLKEGGGGREGGSGGRRAALEVLTRVMGEGPAGGGGERGREGGRESARERMVANPIFRAALLALGVQV